MRLSRYPALVMLASIALFVAGGGTLLFGFSTLAYDLPLASTLVPLAAGTALVAASVGLALATERQLRRDEAGQQALAASAPPSPAKRRPKPARAAAVAPDRELARWTPSPDEWRAFHEQEAARRRRGAAEHALLGAAFGAVVPWIFTGHWQYSAIGAVLAAPAAAVWTLMSAARLRKREPQAGGGVVVRRNAVEVDGVTALLRDGTWWLSGVKLRDDLPLPVLELSVKRTEYERGGSRRTAEQVVRVPVPRDRVAQAGSVAEQLRRGIPSEDDDG